MDTLEKRLSPMVDSSAAAPPGFHKRAVSRDERSSGGRRQRLIDDRRRRLGDGYAGHVRFVDELRFVYKRQTVNSVKASVSAITYTKNARGVVSWMAYVPVVGPIAAPSAQTNSNVDDRAT